VSKPQTYTLMSLVRKEEMCLRVSSIMLIGNFKVIAHFKVILLKMASLWLSVRYICKAISSLPVFQGGMGSLGLLGSLQSARCYSGSKWVGDPWLRIYIQLTRWMHWVQEYITVSTESWSFRSRFKEGIWKLLSTCGAKEITPSSSQYLTLARSYRVRKG
jgi:hypothetical protein